MTIPEVTPAEIDDRRRAGGSITLLDVREPWELEICAVAWAKAMPMSEVPQRLGELDPGTEIVVMCHHGGRSLRVAHFLAQQGFDRVANLAGGIHAWREQVDPSMAAY
jgi:rhodanese-related sulfurtransferase